MSGNSYLTVCGDEWHTCICIRILVPYPLLIMIYNDRALNPKSQLRCDNTSSQVGRWPGSLHKIFVNKSVTSDCRETHHTTAYVIEK